MEILRRRKGKEKLSCRERTREKGSKSVKKRHKGGTKIANEVDGRQVIRKGTEVTGKKKEEKEENRENGV